MDTPGNTPITSKDRAAHDAAEEASHALLASFHEGGVEDKKPSVPASAPSGQTASAAQSTPPTTTQLEAESPASRRRRPSASEQPNTASPKPHSSESPRLAKARSSTDLFSATPKTPNVTPASDAEISDIVQDLSQLGIAGDDNENKDGGGKDAARSRAQSSMVGDAPVSPRSDDSGISAGEHAAAIALRQSAPPPPPLLFEAMEFCLPLEDYYNRDPTVAELIDQMIRDARAGDHAGVYIAQNALKWLLFPRPGSLEQRDRPESDGEPEGHRYSSEEGDSDHGPPDVSEDDGADTGTGVNSEDGEKI
ncbi:uncharacterized protein B0I36DRAFT_353181 [Microdochium trichocladiopsis]|uniref:Uncharacterized protein n=1 Tax=Microdochium trichocladiopsis TaxID=1682393 RepID=A0A9P8XXD9_9PEZI|nr:uncharacterized protein B0I36DRAFT_353181 [Microdochium trichocladiopsis]KAH7025004.1 hypothetical protein B0I36DRAFT_353181 [Microdochium trichocladiopsis]